MSYDMALWELIRASGLLAYVLLSISVALGIAVRVRALDWLLKRAWAFELHQVIAILALVLTAVHVSLLLFNNHVRFGVIEIILPFAAGWRPLPAALGTLSLYLVLLLVISSYMRPRIGQRTWRAIHYGGFVAWAFALLHGITAGSDSSTPWVQYLYLVTGSAVAFLTLFRGLESTVAGRNLPSTAAVSVQSQRHERTAAGHSGTLTRTVAARRPGRISAMAGKSEWFRREPRRS